MSDPHGGSLIQELQKCQAELSRVKGELEDLRQAWNEQDNGHLEYEEALQSDRDTWKLRAIALGYKDE